MKNLNMKLIRRLAPIMSAGFLLQAGGCTIDPAALGLNFAGVIISGLVQNIVFGVFNLPI